MGGRPALKILIKKILGHSTFLQAVLGILILLSTVALGYVDSKINDYTNTFFLNQNKLNNILLNQIHAAQNTNRFELYAMLGRPQVEHRISSLAVQNPWLKPLLDKCSSNNFGSIGCVNETIDYYAKEYESLASEYAAVGADLERFHQQGTPWTTIKKIIIFLQTSFVLFSIFIAYILQKEATKARGGSIAAT